MCPAPRPTAVQPVLDRPAATHWEFPRSVAGISLLLDFAREHDVPRSAVLRGVGLDESLLSDAAYVVPAAVELAVLGNLSAALGSRDALGLELGSRYHVTAFGILGYAFISSRTVAEAMSLALRFLDLSHIFTVPEVDVRADEVAVALRAVDLPEHLARFLVERDVAAIHTVLSELVPGGVPFTSVELAFPSPPRTAPYSDVLGVVPRFSAPRTVLRFSAEHLPRPLPHANPHSQAMAERLCRDVVSRRRGRSGVTEQVRVWITRNLVHDTSMAGAAQGLAMSQRTLRRRLAESGTGYQALLDEVRQALAEEMLDTGVLSVEDVAQRLGYAEASSFIHAFKRWHGATPTQYRFRRTRPAARGSAG
jgi:AraC-like DNA-binding protein